MKTCRKFLIHIQNSVFEGELTDIKFRKLKKSLEEQIQKKEDSILFHKLHHEKVFMKESLGIHFSKTDNII